MLDVKHLTDHQRHTVSGQYGLDLREGAAIKGREDLGGQRS
jgi:hypothetical protein